MKRERDKKDDYQKGEEHFDEKEAPALSSKTKEQGPFDEKVSSEYVRHGKPLLDYSEKNPEL